MTYLQIINAVLRRLRETEVTDVNETDYSKLIGEYVNSVKKEVEAAWDWNALRTTLTLNTVDPVSLTTPCWAVALASVSQMWLTTPLTICYNRRGLHG
jgi:hypothetical protein